MEVVNQTWYRRRSHNFIRPGAGALSQLVQWQCGDERSAVDDVCGEFWSGDRRGGTEESWGIVTGWGLGKAGIMMFRRMRILGELGLMVVGLGGGGSRLYSRVRISV